MAAALDNNRMLVFGGKGKGGHVFGDTWIYYRDVNQWQLIQNNEVCMPLSLSIQKYNCVQLFDCYYKSI